MCLFLIQRSVFLVKFEIKLNSDNRGGLGSEIVQFLGWLSLDDTRSYLLVKTKRTYCAGKKVFGCFPDNFSDKQSVY